MIAEITKDEALAAVFRALGDQTRLRIFRMLRSCEREAEVDESGQCRPAGALSVGEGCCCFGQGPSTVSQHWRELRLAGLIRPEDQGRRVSRSVNAAGLDLGG